MGACMGAQGVRRNTSIRTGPAREPPLQELAPAATSGLWTRLVHDRPRVSESALSEGTPPVGLSESALSEGTPPVWPWTGVR
eukprot:scaffold1408_cov116-Isochrysis_galbana.AAC.1